METQEGQVTATKKRWAPTVENCVVMLTGVFGLFWAYAPVGDNTFFVHLRTGIDIWNSHSVPSTDPYSYTALGHEWVLQSWLTEVLYGALHALGGTALVITVNCFVLGLVAWTIARLARTGRMPWTFLYAVMAILLSCGQWSNRPTTYAFALFAALVASQKRAILWTALIGLLWVNMHGSWPLGILWLGAVAVGSSIDERKVAKALFVRLSVFVAAVIVGGVVNPVGWKLLAFPLTAVQKGSVFSSIVEWKSPDFHTFSSPSGGVLLPVIVIALFLLVHLRASWRHSVPVLGLLALSLYSQRNLPFFALALVFALGDITRAHFARREAAGEVHPPSVAKWGLIEAFVMVLVVLVPVLGVVRITTAKSPYNLDGYPVTAMAYAESLGYFSGDRHVLMPDMAGCFRILQKGGQAGVFIDDRYDMYPTSFERDASDIFKVKQDTQGLLDSRGVQAVIIQTERPLSAYLSVNPLWQATYKDKNWILYERV